MYLCGNYQTKNTEMTMEGRTYGLKQKRKDKKAFYTGFAILFGFILALVLFVYFAIQHEKNLRAELLKME